MVIVNYYSNFTKLSETTSDENCGPLSDMSTSGIENCFFKTLIVFRDEEFHQFARQWEFKHITSSPRHPHP